MYVLLEVSDQQVRAQAAAVAAQAGLGGFQSRHVIRKVKIGTAIDTEVCAFDGGLVISPPDGSTQVQHWHDIAMVKHGRLNIKRTGVYSHTEFDATLTFSDGSTVTTSGLYQDPEFNRQGRSDPSIVSFNKLLQRIDEYISRTRLQGTIAELNAGRTVAFGKKVELTAHECRFGRKAAPWNTVSGVRIDNMVFVIDLQGRSRPMGRQLVSETPNFVLMRDVVAHMAGNRN